MLRVLKNERRQFRIDQRYYEQLLKQKLKCHFCGSQIRTIPKLKEHLKRCRFGKMRSAKKSELSDDQYEDFKIVFAEL